MQIPPKTNDTIADIINTKRIVSIFVWESKLIQVTKSNNSILWGITGKSFNYQTPFTPTI